MRLREICLLEDFKTTAAAFVKAGIAQGVVDTTIATFRTLANKNQLTGNEKNIDWWAKQGWQAFEKKINSLSAKPTKSELKKGKLASAKSLAVKVPQSAQQKGVVRISIILNFEGSRNIGKNSNFCTTKPDGHQYDQIVLTQQSVLIYIISKTADGKAGFHAISAGENYVAFWDHSNNDIPKEQFVKETGIGLNWLSSVIRANAQAITSERRDEMARRFPEHYGSTSDKSMDMQQDLIGLEEYLRSATL